jgi:hypothetical protein
MATIEARITKVEHDVGTGWYTITTDHASVKRLTTKMEPKAREAAALRQADEVALIEYSAKTRHDESSGRTYNNNYYERAKTAPPPSANGSSGIDSVGGGDTASGIDIASPAASRRDPAEPWRIALSVGAKLAVATLPLMPVEQRTFEVQKQIALAWAQWVFQTPPPGTPAADDGMGFGTMTSSGRPGAYSDPDFDAPPPPGDDDIPF